MEPHSSVNLVQDPAVVMPDAQKGQQVESINEIVASVRQDIKNIKDQFAMLPPAPNSTSNTLFIHFSDIFAN